MSWLANHYEAVRLDGGEWRPLKLSRCGIVLCTPIDHEAEARRAALLDKLAAAFAAAYPNGFYS